MCEEPQGEVRFHEVESVLSVQDSGSFLVDLFRGGEDRGVVIRDLNFHLGRFQAASIVVRSNNPVTAESLHENSLAQVKT